jgi:hypothetical protein
LDEEEEATDYTDWPDSGLLFVSHELHELHELNEFGLTAGSYVVSHGLHGLNWASPRPSPRGEGEGGFLFKSYFTSEYTSCILHALSMPLLPFKQGLGAKDI